MKFERRWLRTAEQTTVSYLDSGMTGPGVVVLHGLAGSGREFISTARALAEHRVLLVDQHGHGHSTRRPCDTSREAFVDEVVRVIEAEFDGPVTVVGQSMGGHTAMLVAAARPDLVNKLVILEGDAGSGTPEERRKVDQFFHSWPVPFPNRNSARRFLGEDPLAVAWTADLEQRADGLHPRFDPDVMVALIGALATPRWQEWERIAVPALVVYGENGMFTDAQKADFVRRGRDVFRVDIPGASHDAHLDATEEWTRVLRNFLLPADDVPTASSALQPGAAPRAQITW